MADADHSTRDIAVQALTKIEEHTKSCDRRYQESNAKQERMLEYLKEMNGQMGQVKDQIAEARGAGKMAKVITGAVSGLMGFVGGLGSHIGFK